MDREKHVGETVCLDGAVIRNKHFVRCHVIYAGGEIDTTGCCFEGCKWEFRGSAGRALMLANAVSGGPFHVFPADDMEEAITLALRMADTNRKSGLVPWDLPAAKAEATEAARNPSRWRSTAAVAGGQLVAGILFGIALAVWV